MQCNLCCEETVGKYQSRIRDIAKQIDQEQSLNRGGRFEWVDSVLVQCLQDGDWLLIENVNFCRYVCHSWLYLVNEVYCWSRKCVTLSGFFSVCFYFAVQVAGMTSRP